MDAYTLRKIAPRILLGVIGINLSIYLCVAAIDITNVIGGGLSQLIMAPFDLNNTLKSNPANNIGAGAISVLAIVGGLSYVALATLGSIFMIIGILALLGLIILTVLALRQALLVFLTIISPIAIALFILPGTEQYFRQWWSLFVKTLMVYPIIAALFAISNVLVSINIAAARDAPSDAAGFLSVLTVIILAFAPLFLIPFAFKFSGGAISTVMGAASSPLKRLGNARQQYTQKKIGESRADLKAGRKFEGSKFLPGSQRAARKLNTVSRGLGTGARGGFGIGARGRTAHHAAIEQAAINTQRAPGWAAVKDNDDALRAGTYDTEQEARAALVEKGWNEDRVNSAVNSWKTSGNKFGDRSAQVAASQAMTVTGTSHENMEDMTQTLARVSHGNSSTASSLAGHANAVSKQVGRWDLAPSYGTLNDLVQAHAGISADPAPTRRQFDEATLKAVRESTDPGTLARTSKPSVFKNLNAVIERNVDNPEIFDVASDIIKEAESNRYSTPGGSTDHIDEMRGPEAGGPRIYRGGIDPRDPRFLPPDEGGPGGPTPPAPPEPPA